MRTCRRPEGEWRAEGGGLRAELAGPHSQK